MGTWGPGNFDDDTAAEHLSILVHKLVGEVEKAMKTPRELEPDEYWGVAVPCNLELLALIGKQEWVGCTLPPPETIEAWKAAYLEVWDAKIDGLSPKPDHKKTRRKELVATFDRLRRLAAKQ